MDQQKKYEGILEYFLHWERETPNAVFLRQPKGSNWKEYSWREVGFEARKIQANLTRLGIHKGDRVALLSQNCAEWIMTDIGIMMGGFVSVPLYANVNASTLNDILTHSEAKLLFIGKMNDKDWDAVKHSIPDIIQTVTFNGYERESITSWKQFLQTHEIPDTVPDVSKHDVFTIIYTSGSTGTPKGVVHCNNSVINALNIAGKEVLLDKQGNRFFSYLPLSHAAERGLVECGAIFSGGSISFVESLESFASNIKNSKPTHFFGVPRIWEKFQEKILESLSQQKLNILLKLPLISSIIKRKIKHALGLQHASVLLSGAAPITSELMIWFQKLGFTIREAYGMSENFNVCSINPANQIRIGTVGKLFGNQEVKIDPDTHEIIQRCDWQMKEYFKDPELTAVTLKNGYLHTGDMGELSDDGFLKVTGRVKDIFKTSKGEYIVPGKIESQFLSLPCIDQACVLGVGYPQPFLIAALSAVGKAMDVRQLIELVKNTLTTYNNSSMEYQKLKKVIIVKDEWTTENGLLTPSLKLKRNALAARYEKALEPHYLSDEKITFE